MFVLLAACAQAPVPLSLVARVLGVQPDSRELDDIRNCALLSPPSMGLRKIETVSVHQVTRSVFMDLFLQDVSTLASKVDGSFYNVSVCKLWQQFHAVAIRAYTKLFSQSCRLPLLFAAIIMILKLFR